MMLFRWVMVLVVLAGAPMPALANCVLTGTLVRVDVLEAGRKGVHTLYAREYQTDPYYYVFRTPNQVIASAALGLAAIQTRVEIVGNASRCPGSGQERFGGDVLKLTAGP